MLIHIMLYRDDMGLGKTIQCISLLWSVSISEIYYPVYAVMCRTLLKQDAYGGKPVVKRALVVTPGSLVKVSVYVSVHMDMYNYIK